MFSTTDPGTELLPRPRWREWLPGLLLLAVTWIAYIPAYHGGFVWDDDTYVTQNTMLTAPDGLRRIWFSLQSPSQYFPLTFTTFYFERALWGLHPLGYHLVNIFLHAANAFLLWRLLARLRLPGAWLAAAIFALHPVQVESVAWITERKNVLMGFFFLLTLWGWVKCTDAKTVSPWRWYVFALICFPLALAAKTTACTLPVGLLLILWLTHRPIDGRRLAQVAPFLLMGIAMGCMTMWWEKYHQGTQGKTFGMPLLDRLLLACRALWFYAGKLLWPTNLTFSYPRWNISTSDPGAWAWVAATAALGVAVIWLRRWFGRGVEVALAFFAVTLSPLLGFIMLYTFVYTFVADHYQYLACIGPMALAAGGIETGLRRLPRGRTLWPAACAILLLTLGILTWRQAGTYADQETLWRTTIARNPDCWLAENDLGVILFDRGQLDEAIALFRKSEAVQPGNAETCNNLGAALDKKGQLDEAVAQFQQAVVLRPNFSEAHRNLGDILLRQGKVDEAITQFQAAVALRPDIARAHRNLGDALLRRGETNEANVEFQKALEQEPDNAQSHYDLGVNLLQKGQTDEAIIEFQKAVALRPDFAEAQNNLGYGLFHQGRVEEAITHLDKALEVQPDYGPAHYNLGNALLQQGRVDEAIVQFQKLLALQPGLAAARNALASIAWQLATSPDASRRNGTKAVAVAEKLAGDSDPKIAATLAAAQAEAGQFVQAVVEAQRALLLASQQNNVALMASLQEQLRCYQAGLPFHEKAGAP